MSAEPRLAVACAPICPEHVRKRDGTTIQAFNQAKIHHAIEAAWLEARKVADADAIASVREHVLFALPSGTIDVEQIQDCVEICLMKAGYLDVAKAYIVYRDRRAEARRARQGVDPQAIADYIHLSKYARHLPDEERREVFEETVARVEAMHLRRFPQLESEIRRAFDHVRAKRVLPSMRSMQFAGPAAEANNLRIYNCSATLIDRPRAFAEVLYLLLCGCGVGYSVQFEHVDQLPKMGFVDEDVVVHVTVPDTIEGWADALFALVHSHIHGYFVEFNYSQIRAKGTPLKTSGGQAPGHMGLRKALEQIRAILGAAAGRKLRPIECYDVLCHAADAVLSGGVRRSATICLFSPEDSEMMYAKTGDWWKKAPWRTNSNNSVAFLRHKVEERQFKRVFEMTRDFGEPGFVFLSDRDHATNPCAEIGLAPTLEITEEIARRRGLSQDLIGHVATGFAFCNLCTINAAAISDEAEFLEAARAATLIGTLQASYTSMPYLAWVSEEIAQRDALLGVSITGMLDNPTLACDPGLQHKAAQEIKRWNEIYAADIGIRAAARTTCVKPEGTGSLVLRAVAPGHHAHHARRYFRRVIAKPTEPVFQFFRSHNPSQCVKKPNGDYVIEFCIEAPPEAILKEDFTALEFLEMVRSTQRHWVIPGTRDTHAGLHHNVSNTVQVQDHEWAPVADYLWTHRGEFTAVSLLPATGDKLYSFAPFEAVTTEADETRWNQILANYRPVDYRQMHEANDETRPTQEVACAGGACLL